MIHQQEAAVVVARTTDTVASAIWVDALKQEGINAKGLHLIGMEEEVGE